MTIYAPGIYQPVWRSFCRPAEMLARAELQMNGKWRCECAPKWLRNPRCEDDARKLIWC